MSIAMVQEKTGSNTTGTTLTVTFDAGVTSGNLLVALAVTNDPTITADWTEAIKSDNVADGDTCGVYYKIADGSETGMTMTTAGNTKHMIIREYSGIAASPLDKTTATTPSAGVVTITAGATGALSQADELIVAVAAIRADTTAESVDTPMSLIGTGDGAFSGIFSAAIVASTSSVTPTFNWTTAGTAWACGATFKAAPSGVGPMFMGV